jgi:CheY-like chemotaxis protein
MYRAEQTAQQESLIALKKILIVDDEFLIRYSLSHMLKSDTVEVTAVSTGSGALQEISTKGPFDLCCFDIHLPDLNGLELMKRIRSTSPHTTIIMMTGGEVTEAMLKDIQNNAELLLSKPFDLFKVKTFVDQILQLGQPAHRNETNGLGNHKAFEYRLMHEQRRHERHLIVKQITYETVSPRPEQEKSAEVIDICEGGMCVMTKSLLAPGCVVRIIDEKTGECTGAVRWSSGAGSTELYRTGIQFVPSQTGR